MSIDPRFPSFLRARRRHLELTAELVAEAAGLSIHRYRQLEMGYLQKFPSVRVATGLCTALQVSCNVLAFVSGYAVSVSLAEEKLIEQLTGRARNSTEEDK